MNKKKKIIILGASGYIGKRLIKKLLEDEEIKNNYQLILFNKNRRKLSYLTKQYKNIAISDIDINIDNIKLLEKTFKDAEVLYNLVHITNETNFLEKEAEFNHVVGKAAENANVKHVIFLGGLGDKNEELSNHLYSRINSGKILRQYNVPVTEFKVGFIIGAGNLAFEILQRISAFLPFVIKPRNEKKMTPAFIDNVVNYLYKAFKYSDIFKNKILELGNGEYYYSDMIIKTKEILTGKKPYIITIPDSLYKILIKSGVTAYLFSLISGHNKKLIENTVDLVLYDTTRREEYKIEKNIPEELLEPQYKLEEMIQKAIERIKSGTYISFWDYPTIYSKLSKRSGLELKDNYVIKEYYKIINKKFIPDLWYEIKNISCQLKEDCWTKNFIWKFRGFINKIIGGINYKNNNKIDLNNIKIGDVLGYWQVDNIIDKEDIKEFRLVALLNSPGTEYMQFLLKKIDEEDYVLITRNIYLLSNPISYFHYYIFYPFYNNVLKKITENLIYYSQKKYACNQILKNKLEKN